MRTIKGLGRIYLQTGIDGNSNFGFTKVYQDKKKNAINFAKTKEQSVY